MSVGKAVLGLFTFSVLAVLVFAASGPLLAVVAPPHRTLSQATHTYIPPHTQSSSLPTPSASAATASAAVVAAAASPPPPLLVSKTATSCGDGYCQFPETVDNCLVDCPGITTPESCGEEPHSDPQGVAVVDGRGHHLETAAECCQACATHAAKNPKRPCNSWVFCALPHCWSADGGNTHLFGECWLKWQTDPSHPLYGQRGRYDEEYRRRHRLDHLTGKYPTDENSAKILKRFGITPGSQRNITVPTHVVWLGGVMGAPRTYPRVTWETGADGTMRSSAGDVVVDYRPWESKAQNLARGVKPEQMRF